MFDCSVSVSHVVKQNRLQVIRFPEAVEVALEELMPNRLTDYLYDLSDKFNSFYTECKVSGTLCLDFKTRGCTITAALAGVHKYALP